MNTNTLLSGLAGFFIGGLLVATAATVINKPQPTPADATTMSEMTRLLKDKTGDDYDKLFIEHMIAHHEGALDMAKLSATNAKHDEIKKLSNDIIRAQENEISLMKQWQIDWKYTSTSKPTAQHAH